MTVTPAPQPRQLWSLGAEGIENLRTRQNPVVGRDPSARQPTRYHIRLPAPAPATSVAVGLTGHGRCCIRLVSVVCRVSGRLLVAERLDGVEPGGLASGVDTEEDTDQGGEAESQEHRPHRDVG